MNTGEISSKIRNIFQPAELVKRNDDGSVQIKTAYSRTVDNLEEAFPYGLKSKAKKGNVTVLCAGGNLDAIRILPVESVEGAPELKEGDVALWNEAGVSIILRDEGKIEITNGKQNITKLILNLLDALIQFKTFGTPVAQQTDPSSVQSLTKIKENWKQLFKEGE